jgi:tetratricopeptide (TPR) repeat protein
MKFRSNALRELHTPLFAVGLLILLLFLFNACATKAELSDTMAPAELVQRAQEASDRNRYSLSLEYYQAILDRFPSNSDYVCEAEYEIGLIHSKQKKYELAKTELTDLLARYKQIDAELLPPQYKILAEIVVARIEEKIAKSNRSGAATESE